MPSDLIRIVYGWHKPAPYGWYVRVEGYDFLIPVQHYRYLTSWRYRQPALGEPPFSPRLIPMKADLVAAINQCGLVVIDDSCPPGWKRRNYHGMFHMSGRAALVDGVVTFPLGPRKHILIRPSERRPDERGGVAAGLNIKAN